MKLNNEKNIRLCQKVLYTKQLECYSNLCSLYKKLAQIHGGNSEEIYEFYSKPLTCASNGNLNFENLGIFEPLEISIFTEYSNTVNQIKNYGVSATILNDAITYEQDNANINYEKLNSFENYMQENSMDLLDTIKNMNKNFIAIASSIDAVKYQKLINSIDNNHIENPIDISPIQYGANFNIKNTIKNNSKNKKYKRIA